MLYMDYVRYLMVMYIQKSDQYQLIDMLLKAYKRPTKLCSHAACETTQLFKINWIYNQ